MDKEERKVEERERKEMNRIPFRKSFFLSLMDLFPIPLSPRLLAATPAYKFNEVIIFWGESEG